MAEGIATMNTILKITLTLSSVFILSGYAEAGPKEAIERGARAAASGIERGVKAAGNGIERGAKAAGNGIERGAKATESALNGVAE